MAVLPKLLSNIAKHSVIGNFYTDKRR